MKLLNDFIAYFLVASSAITQGKLRAGSPDCQDCEAAFDGRHFADTNYDFVDLYSVSIIAVKCAISCYMGPRYNATLVILFMNVMPVLWHTCVYFRCRKYFCGRKMFALKRHHTVIDWMPSRRPHDWSLHESQSLITRPWIRAIIPRLNGWVAGSITNIHHKISRISPLVSHQNRPSIWTIIHCTASIGQCSIVSTPASMADFKYQWNQTGDVGTAGLLSKQYVWPLIPHILSLLFMAKAAYFTAYVAVRRSPGTTYTAVGWGLLLLQYVLYQFRVWAGIWGWNLVRSVWSRCVTPAMGWGKQALIL